MISSFALILVVKKPIFTTFSPVYQLAIFIKHRLIINSMQSMYIVSNIKITNPRTTIGDDKNGIE